ncbi:MAG: TolC family protein [candidate division Zixibacteria bacterium]|nr:TolC family protein [candidate division Zixibacteria bacterium]
MTPLATTAGEAPRQVKIGFFEGGEYPSHEILREAFRNELKGVLPEGFEVVYIYQGFKTAGWDREQSRKMARELTELKDLDLVVTLGPWTVEDLLAAGFSKPIIAMNRFDPETEGLVDSTGYPIADNLTVRLRPDKFEDDLAIFNRLRKIEKLGVLFFPSGNERDKLMARFQKIGEQLGFEVITAEGYNNIGTFAFFKAYLLLKEQGVDAIYISPLWGFDLVKINWFFRESARDRIPVFTSEGYRIVQRGALASNSLYDISSVARYQAYKVRRILQGALPADLPVTFPEMSGLIINEAVADKFHVAVPDETVTAIEVVPAQPDETTPIVTLSQAIEQAYQANPGYLAGFDAVRAAAEEAGRASAVYLPRLYATGSARLVDDNTVYNYRDEVKKDQLGFSLNLEQQIFSMGAIRSIQLAAGKKDKQEITFKEAALDLELAVVTAYLNYLKAEEILDIYLEKKKYIEYNLEISQADQYLVDPEGVDVYRWRDEFFQVIREISESRKNIIVARMLFNLLLSQPGHTPFVLDTARLGREEWQGEYARMQPYLFDRRKARLNEDYLVEAALAGNPSLAARGADIELQKIRLAANSARFWPSLGFKTAFNIADSLEDFSPTFEEKDRTWSVGAVLHLPLFSGKDRFKERGALKAHLSELEYQKDNVRLEIIGRTRSLATETYSRLSRFPDDREGINQARVYADMMMRRYSAGEVSLVGVVDAIDNYALARLRETADRYGYFETAAQLVRTVGWSLRDSRRTPGMELLYRLYDRSQPDIDED